MDNRRERPELRNICMNQEGAVVHFDRQGSGDSQRKLLMRVLEEAGQVASILEVNQMVLGRKPKGGAK